MLSVHLDEKFGGEVNGVFICFINDGGLIPLLAADRPCSRSAAMICSSVNLDRFMVQSFLQRGDLIRPTAVPGNQERAGRHHPGIGGLRHASCKALVLT
jgi:hypothetical protein